MPLAKDNQQTPRRPSMRPTRSRADSRLTTASQYSNPEEVLNSLRIIHSQPNLTNEQRESMYQTLSFMHSNTELNANTNANRASAATDGRQPSYASAGRQHSYASNGGYPRVWSQSHERRTIHFEADADAESLSSVDEPPLDDVEKMYDNSNKTRYDVRQDSTQQRSQSYSSAKVPQYALDEKSADEKSSSYSSEKMVSGGHPTAMPVSEKPVLDPFDPRNFPDGGARAWLTVAGAFSLMFVSFGWVNTIGVWQDYYAENQLLGYSPGAVSWIPSLQIFFMFVCGPFIGVVYDNFGPRALITVGSLFHVFGLMMTSISKTYYQILLSQSICSALGASLLFFPGMNCVSTWFFKKRGAAIGVVVAGSSLGGVIFPIMVSHLIGQVGFGWTMRICAFLILALCVFADFAVVSRLPPVKRPFHFLDLVRPMKDPRLLLLDVSVFFFMWGMFIPFTYVVVEARAQGMSEMMSYYLVAMLNGASFFGRTLPNILGDKIGRFNVMIVMSLLSTILVLALWLQAHGNASLIVFACLFGFSSGAGISLSPALVATISDIKEIGTRTGTMFMFGAVAGLTGSPIGGAILDDAHGDFTWPIVFAGVSLGISFVLFTVTRITVGGVKPWSKV